MSNQFHGGGPLMAGVYLGFTHRAIIFANVIAYAYKVVERKPGTQTAIVEFDTEKTAIDSAAVQLASYASGIATTNGFIINEVPVPSSNSSRGSYLYTDPTTGQLMVLLRSGVRVQLT